MISAISVVVIVTCFESGSPPWHILKFVKSSRMGKIILSTTFNWKKEEKEYLLPIFFVHSRPLRLLSLRSLKRVLSKMLYQFNRTWKSMDQCCKKVYFFFNKLVEKWYTIKKIKVRKRVKIINLNNEVYSR